MTEAEIRQSERSRIFAQLLARASRMRNGGDLIRSEALRSAVAGVKVWLGKMDAAERKRDARD